MTQLRSLAPTIYLVAFISDGVLMGFEMLGSRYIFCGDACGLRRAVICNTCTAAN